MNDFRGFMDVALEEARAAAGRGEVPVGAAIVCDGEVIARAGNRMRELTDPTAHAEMLAIRAACAALGTERLTGCDLWVTLEPLPGLRGGDCRRTALAALLRRVRSKVGRGGWRSPGLRPSAGPLENRTSMAGSARRRPPRFCGTSSRRAGGSARPRAPVPGAARPRARGLCPHASLPRSFSPG